MAERPGLTASDPTMYLGDAARRLGITAAAVRKAVGAQRPAIRGLAPHSALNPTGKWLVSVADVEAELRRRGRPPIGEVEPPLPQGETLADLRIEMLQGALSESQDARIGQAEQVIADLRTQVAERDARIARLERQLAGYARSVAELLATD